MERPRDAPMLPDGKRAAGPAVAAISVWAGAIAFAGCSGGSENSPEFASLPTRTPTATPTLYPSPTPRAFPTATPVPPPPVEMTRITWESRQWYLHGANVPWFNWGCDFGCGANGGAGLTRGRPGGLAGKPEAQPSGPPALSWGGVFDRGQPGCFVGNRERQA